MDAEELVEDVLGFSDDVLDSEEVLDAAGASFVALEDPEVEVPDEAPLSPESPLVLFLPEFLKSVSYQPVPFSRKAAADTCLRSVASPHSGQNTRGSSESF